MQVIKKRRKIYTPENPWKIKKLALVWEITTIETEKIDKDSLHVYFDKKIKINQLQKTLDFLDKRAKDLLDAARIEIGSEFDKNVLMVDPKTKQCSMIIHVYKLHIYRMYGMSQKFMPPETITVVRNSLKTVTLHPLLMRMYCCKSFSNASNMMVPFELAQLYNFGSIVASWCNRIQPFINEKSIENALIKPTSPRFKLYQYFHRLIDRWYSDLETDIERPREFVDLFFNEGLASIMGTFLCMEKIKRISVHSFRAIGTAAVEAGIYDRKPWNAGALERHKQIFGWAKQYVFRSLTEPHVKSSDSEVIEQNEVLYIDLNELRKCVAPETDEELFVETFIGDLYSLLADHGALTHKLARRIMKGIRIETTSLTGTENCGGCTNYKFCGYKMYTRCLRNDMDYMDLVAPAPDEAEKEIQFVHTKAVIERVAPLELFLSILDQQMMQSLQANRAHIETVVLSKSKSKSKSKSRYHNGQDVYNVASPFRPEMVDLLYKPSISLPVEMEFNIEGKMTQIHYHNTCFYLISCQ